MGDCLDVMLLAASLYNRADYRRAAERCGEFMILAQLPEPQPAWAQQYDAQMHPAWARKFEPPSVSGLESQKVIRALLQLYEQTAARKYLEPIPRALDYLERSKIDKNQLARFYELNTNRPLYFTKAYALTYDDGDLPTHYGFKVGNDLARLRAQYEKFATGEAPKPRRTTPGKSDPPSPALEAEARSVLAALDDSGRWLTDGALKSQETPGASGQIITTETFIKHVDVLSRYLGAVRGSR